MKSEQIVIEAPLSFTGSAKRLWRKSDSKLIKYLVLVPIICLVWSFVIFWYMFFGLLVVPYRLIRRSGRKQKRDKLRHSELIEAMQKK